MPPLSQIRDAPLHLSAKPTKESSACYLCRGRHPPVRAPRCRGLAKLSVRQAGSHADAVEVFLHHRGLCSTEIFYTTCSNYSKLSILFFVTLGPRGHPRRKFRKNQVMDFFQISGFSKVFNMGRHLIKCRGRQEVEKAPASKICALCGKQVLLRFFIVLCNLAFIPSILPTSSPQPCLT